MPEPIRTEEKWLQKLVEKGLLKPSQRDEVLKEHKSIRGRVMDLLLKRNYLTEQDLAVFLSEEMAMPLVNPLSFKIEPEVLSLIPFVLARRYQVVPVSRFDRSLMVAMTNPLDLILIDDLEALTGCKIKPVLTMPSLLEQAIRRFYTPEEAEGAENASHSLEDIVKELEEVKGPQAQAKGPSAVDLAKEAEQTPVIKIANLILLEAIRRQASDLFVEPWEKYVRVRCRVDGLLEEVKRLPATMAQVLVSRIKVMSRLDIAERRMPQDGRFKARVQNREIDFRVSVIPTSYGEKICIRLLDKRSQGQALDSLGFTEREIKKIRYGASRPHGMILITGPTGSGKTTTLYSILNFLHRLERNITTVEDPVEYQVAGINQVNVNDTVGLTFAAALRSILRQDPNIVMIGEIRDLETMDISMKAALTGHLVLSTLHTNDAPSSIVRMLNMGIEPFLITSSVIMVTAQRLIRKLCPACKEPFPSSPEILKTLKAPAGARVTLYKPQGCPSCRSTGFAGRRVITEVLELTPAIKELILNRATGDEIKQRARREGMSTLRESGFQKVLAGETTLEEVLRITATDRELAPEEPARQPKGTAA